MAARPLPWPRSPGTGEEEGTRAVWKTGRSRSESHDGEHEGLLRQGGPSTPLRLTEKRTEKRRLPSASSPTPALSRCAREGDEHSAASRAGEVLPRGDRDLGGADDRK